MQFEKRKCGLINEINYLDPFSWENKIFFTTDIDWACDEVLQYCIDLFKENNCKVTWFVTHQTRILEQLRSDNDFELGIHPNFNPLLIHGSFEKGKNALEILQSVKKIVPESVSVRSHSLTQNSMLLKLFNEIGIRYELNTYIAPFQGINLKPFFYHFNMVKLPYMWQDDSHLECGYDYRECLEFIKSSKGITIINFHPIHLFLNSEVMDRYNGVRDILNNFNILKENVNLNKYGIRNFFQDICTNILSEK